MAIKPILFNTEMVRATLDGRKKCTRRVIKPQPDEKHTYPLGFVNDSTERKNIGSFGFGTSELGGSIQYVKPPYQPGDILYVRETWCDDRPFTHDDTPGQYFYRADTMYPRKGDHVYMNVKWHPSIHMPKEAARIWLKVTSVRVERLQEITSEQICKEGVEVEEPYVLNGEEKRYAFSNLWDSTIKKSDLDRYGLDASPWVWVIEFERCEEPEGV